MPKYNLVLFDMDGTIANTDELVVETMFELYDLYRGGKRTPREDCYYFSGPPIRESLKKEFPDMDVEFLAHEFYLRSKDKYDIMVTPYPHSRDVKLKIRDMGIKLGVVTNKRHDLAEHCLEVINLHDQIFDVLIGFDDVKEGKPSPEGIYKAMDALGVHDKKKVLYVGDNYLDELTAKNAGIDVAIVTWGSRKIDERAKPTYFINDYRELLEVVK